MMKHTRSAAGMASIDPDKHALFLDFDGTLAPLQADPDTVTLSIAGEQTLIALRALFSDALVLISGRDVRDLSARTPLELWRVGGHGLEICAPGQAPERNRTAMPPHMLAPVQALTAAYQGVRMEEKGEVVAIHYRQNPSVEFELVQKVHALAKAMPGYKSQNGKMVIELKPNRANKGRTLSAMMQQPAFAGRLPVMVGDDTTDEDAMEAAAAAGGFGVKVGSGVTSAAFRLDDPAAVWHWLRRIIDEHT
ncbi:MAG: trehalose-phosphatase [Pseudomonadota bacterium]